MVAGPISGPPLRSEHGSERAGTSKRFFERAGTCKVGVASGPGHLFRLILRSREPEGAEAKAAASWPR